MLKKAMFDGKFFVTKSNISCDRKIGNLQKIYKKGFIFLPICVILISHKTDITALPV